MVKDPIPRGSPTPKPGEPAPGCTVFQSVLVTDNKNAKRALRAVGLLYVAAYLAITAHYLVPGLEASRTCKAAGGTPRFADGVRFVCAPGGDKR